jgi:hypothetical protein
MIRTFEKYVFIVGIYLVHFYERLNEKEESDEGSTDWEEWRYQI